MTDFTPGPFADYQTLERVARKALADGKANGLHDTREIAAEMRMNRQADLRKTAVIGGGYNGSGISFATARPRDPMFYWREANLPFEYTKDEEIIRLRQYARLVYLTDPVMASCIDVYSYWPLTGMHVEYKDPSIQDFYEELFMDENSGLNYQEFLPEMLHEYWLCSLPGEMITTSQGPVPIEEVVPGGLALTHQSRWGSIRSVSARQLKTQVYRVKPYYGEVLSFTEGHKFLVRRCGEEQWLPVEELTEDDYLFVPIDEREQDRSTISVWDNLEQGAYQLHAPFVDDPSWYRQLRRAKVKSFGQFQQMGVPYGAIVRKKREGRPGRWSILARTEYDLTPALLRLFGLFVAEGCALDDGVQFSYSWDEEDTLAKETVELVHQVFGLTAKVRPQYEDGVQSGTNVVVYNCPLGDWFGAMFGHGAKAKKLPEWLMLLPVTKLAPFIRGWLDGDGHWSEGDSHAFPRKQRDAFITTASTVLAHQLETLVQRAGFVSRRNKSDSVKDGTPCTSWRVGPVTAQLTEFMEFLGWSSQEVAQIGTIKDRDPWFAIPGNGGYWVKVCWVRSEPYEGPVYDLTVEGDHSFVASHIAVHNCGESFPLGHFNELLGIWEYDELINADDVKVIKSPFMREPRFELKVPEEIRKIVVEREPKWEFTKLVQAYPEFLRLAQTEEFMPVSNDLMRQVAFKCLTLGTQVMTPSGPIEARRLERGDRVVAWDEKTNTPVFSQVTYIKDNGIKPIHHVRTQQGRSVRVTGNHPFLTDQGWVDASLLVPGSRLVVGANNDHGSKYLDLDVARFLGMMMGDGSCGTKRSSQTIKFHNIDTELLDWLNEFVGRYDCHMVLDKRCSWLVTRIDGGKGPTRLNAVRSLLKEVGLFGQNTFTKRVPKVVWQGGPKAWAAFLSGYFDTDGYYNRDRGMAMWASANRPLLEDCQTLLAYLGVNSTVQEIKAPSVTTMKKNGEMCQPYRLVVSRRYTSMLASLLTPLLPRKQIVDRGWYQRKLTAQQAEDIRQRVLAGEKQNALAKEYGVGTSSVQAIIRGKSFAPVEPVLYDKVVSVTVEDPELTLAIGVEKYRNFITGGLVTHNSDKFHHRGLPIMMRAFRSLYQQEMLNAAMDSIASRLYTPLVLVRLGASAQDTGTDTAWVPTAQQLEEFQESLDIALAADFRVLTSHFATQVDLVFGREAMPDLGPDFDRLMDNKLLAFGLSRTMLMGASCLAGDTEVHLNRASKGYRTTIEKLARRYAGEPICGRPWDPEVPTFISRADGDVVRLGLVGNVWFSGVKETFELVTESGKTVRASAQHPFLTASGEWVELGELNVGDQVQVNTGRSMGEDLAFRQGYKFVFTSYHPYQVNDGWHRAQYRYKVSVHRAVMDAALNNLSYKEFIRIVREDPLRSKELVYLDPAQFHVHHLDENKKNNELSNLMVLPKVDHLRHHAEEGGKNHVLWQVGSERITSIRSFGEEPTFDIGVLDAPHNFLANDFVVHNSGETYAADALNRDVVTQMLTRAQRQAKRHFSQRAKMVAQAQGHYETEKQGGRTKIIMQEVLIVDPDGTRRIERKPKLMTPKLMLDVLNLHDEQAERAFIETIVAQGIPISARTRLRGTKIDLDDELEKVKGEQVRRAVVAEETRRDLFLELQEKRLPIEEDLEQDFQAKTNEAQMAEDNPAMMIDPMTGMPMAPPGSADQGTPLPSPAVPTGDTTALTPLTPEENEENPPAPTGAPGQAPVAAAGPGIAIPVPVQRQRPPESDEQRKRMPKASANGYVNGNGNGKLHWHFTGSVDQYLADWPDVGDDVVLPFHLGADYQGEGRHSHDDPIEPHLGYIQHLASTFHADPHNKVEVLDPQNEEHRTKLQRYGRMAAKDSKAWGTKEGELLANGTWDPEAHGRITAGHGFMAVALDHDPSNTKSRVAVATHKGRPVAAMDFEHHEGSRKNWLHVGMLGSSHTVKGAATAVQHAVARYGVDNDAETLDSTATSDSRPYHRMIGRVVDNRSGVSSWNRSDLGKIAGLDVHQSVPRTATLVSNGRAHH